MLTLTKTIRSCRHAIRSRMDPRRIRRGSTFTTVAVMAPVLMGFTAMGVDWGMVAVARNQVQAAADAAAIAATTSMDNLSIAEARAIAYAQEVKINDLPVSVDEISYGFWDGVTFDTSGDDAANAVRVVTSAQVEMPFTKILGLDTVTVRGVAGAGPKVVAKRAPDIVMVLDVTCSMSDAEVAAERVAAEAMLDCINENATPDSRISMVTFGGVDFMLNDMTEMQAGGYTELYDNLDEIISCRDGGAPCSNTNQASGYRAALDILANADTPPEVGQAIMLMSDGEPVPYMICEDRFYEAQDRGEVKFDVRGHCAGVPERWYRQGWRWNYGQMPTDAHYTQWADDAKTVATEAGIDVYTVYYGNNRAGQEFLEDHILTGDNAFPGVAYTRSQIMDRFVDVCQAYTVGNAGLLF